jgi:hypothetical protein
MVKKIVLLCLIALTSNAAFSQAKSFIWLKNFNETEGDFKYYIPHKNVNDTLLIYKDTIAILATQSYVGSHAGSSALPSGGVLGDVIVKNSSTAGDASWGQTLTGTYTLSNTLTTKTIAPSTTGFNLGSTSFGYSTVFANTLQASGTGQAVAFKQASTERARFAVTTGNLLINTTTDDAVTGHVLQVNGSITGTWAGAVLTSAFIPSATVYNNQANTYTAGMKQTFQATTTTAGANLAGVASDPSVLVNGDIWHNTTNNNFKYRVNGTTRIFVNLDEAQVLTNKDLTSGTNTFPTSLATLTGSQALTNKDLTSGTNTFPTSLATLTGTQTLTNKTIAAGSNTITGLTNTNLSGTAGITYANLQNFSAHKMIVNNTSSAATATEDDFNHPGQQTYTGTIAWDATPPGGTTGHSYNWSRIGNMVILFISLTYTTAGVNNTNVTMTLPTDCPSPVQPTGTSATSTGKWYVGTGFIDAALTGGAAQTRASLQSDGSGGWKLSLNVGATAAKMAQMTVIYWTN